MELGLGTVQFGIDYGISNKEGKVPAGKVRTLLEIAYDNNIRVLDTAPVYGDSESVLGQAIPDGTSFRIVTKIPAVKKDYISEKDLAFISETFCTSLTRLRTEQVTGLLMHSPGDLLAHGGDKIYGYMRSLKDQGRVKKIGISVYSGDEIDRLFHHYDFDLVQLPLNVLDQRLSKSGHIAKLKRKRVEIHVRSVFLQGLLLMPLDNINPYFSPILRVLENYRAFLDKHELSPVEGALGFLSAQKELDILLIGVTNKKQLMENIKAFKTKSTATMDFSQFAVEENEMINPYVWKLQ